MDSKPRVSWEKRFVDALKDQLDLDEHTEVFSGMGSPNRYGVPEWELTILQQFQFGDIRFETTNATIVIEVESAGGLTNLVKYWPLLETGLPKRFVLFHLFRIGTLADYIAHRRLWDYTVDRMRSDLQSRCGRSWLDDWEASLHNYKDEGDIGAVAELICAAI